MTRSKIHYFGEGETEVALLNFLKRKGSISPGKKASVFNIWQNRAQSITRRMNKNDSAFIVIDTDKTLNKEIFLKNIDILQKQKINICLMVQCNDLEDELYYACGKKDKAKLFFDFYDTRSEKEFKNSFSNEKYNNIERKLEKNKFDFKMLWSRNEKCFSDFLSENNLDNSVYIFGD